MISTLKLIAHCKPGSFLRFFTPALLLFLLFTPDLKAQFQLDSPAYIINVPHQFEDGWRGYLVKMERAENDKLVLLFQLRRFVNYTESDTTIDILQATFALREYTLNGELINEYIHPLDTIEFSLDLWRYGYINLHMDMLVSNNKFFISGTHYKQHFGAGNPSTFTKRFFAIINDEFNHFYRFVDTLSFLHAFRYSTYDQNIETIYMSIGSDGNAPYHFFKYYYHNNELIPLNNQSISNPAVLHNNKLWSFVTTFSGTKTLLRIFDLSDNSLFIDEYSGFEVKIPVIDGNTNKVTAMSRDLVWFNEDISVYKQIAYQNLHTHNIFSTINYVVLQQLIQTSNGGFLGMGNVCCVSFPGSTGYLYFSVKTDAQGQLEWSHVYFPEYMAVTDIVGLTEVADGYVFAARVDLPPGGLDEPMLTEWLVKVHKNGRFDLDTITSVHDVPQAMPLILFPNPSPGHLYIETEKVFDSAIRIYDLHGRLCHTANIASRSEISLHHLPNGWYVLKYVDKSNGATVSRKFLLSK